MNLSSVVLLVIPSVVRTWWRQDRIRTCRSCGRLLTLDVGARLLIDDQLFEVAGRWPQLDSAGDEKVPASAPERTWSNLTNLEPFEVESPQVEYWLSPASDQFEPMSELTSTARPPVSVATTQNLWTRLSVPLAPGRAIRLVQPGHEVELLSEQIIVLGSSGRLAV